ncbi:rhomboid family intramembrane serine protease [Alteromonas flava]|uniref:rhomboid family intramembrane serine protease n=1 Tax=Alteromonas flava TaxID=2048003 RepID=UPI000C293830|nr:rhomboid family intramembrane serine protease [Alteromonas flava]
MQHELKQSAKLLVAFALVLFAIELVNLITQRGLIEFGLFPRQLNTLPMILTSPFIHGSWQHFWANFVSLLVFAGLILLQGRMRFFAVSLWIILFTGLAVWLFARSAIHVGASGLIYGYFGYLLLAGWRSRQKRMLIVSLVVAVLYGSMVFGVLPTRGFISWESHLFGFFSGLVAAWYWAK